MNPSPLWDGAVVPGLCISRERLTIMAGPCMLESLELGLNVGRRLKEICVAAGVNFIFKSSYDKANRTSKSGVRGPGLAQGLAWLEAIRAELEVPVLTDVHTAEQAAYAGKVCDVLQIPAFLFEQRSLLEAAAHTGRVVQIKKGQHACAAQMLVVGRFLRSCGNPKVILCDRGTSFGYNNLVADMRNLQEMADDGFRVTFDATHAAQLPGAGGGHSSGLRHVVPALARAAVGVGVDALFLEVHENPAAALSDAATQLDLAMAEKVIHQVVHIHEAVRRFL